MAVTWTVSKRGEQVMGTEVGEELHALYIDNAFHSVR